MAQTLSVRPLTPTIGAIIDGVDLSGPLDKKIIEEISQALVTYHVIFFEKQNLTPARHIEFAREFGDRVQILPVLESIAGVPEIIVLDTHEKNPPTNDVWHTDETCIADPPIGTILTAEIIPPIGGDTCWASSIAAYNALSEPFRKFLDGLTAMHDVRKNYRVEDTKGDDKKWAEALAKHPPVAHPVVRTHPVTGKKGLFVNGCFTTRIVELSKVESDTVLNYLYAHQAKPEFIVRWKWSVGDVAFWDNRLTQHYALADYMPYRRVMHRATILGEKKQVA